MPDLGLVTGTIRRARGELPQMPLVNMFVETAITEPRQFSLLSFPGLVEVGATLGAGPVGALFQMDGVLAGQRFAVSAQTFYAGETAVGGVGGPVTPSIAGNEIGVVATSGNAAVYWSGSALSTIAFPDSAAVRKVVENGGRFLFIRDDTHRFYWTAVLADMLSGETVVVDALDFASAESEPDKLVDGLTLDDGLVLGGTQTIEFWTKTGDNELPYAPITGRVYRKGVRATGCMALLDNTFAWVSPDNIVYRGGNVPERISEAGIEELIAASIDCRADSYFFEGHEFLKIGLDDTTIEFDAQTRQWNERKTGSGEFYGGPVIAGPIYGGRFNGKLYALDGYADMGTPHERSFCVFQPINGGTMPVDNVRLRTNPGHTDYLSGDYSNPVIELIQSFDGGFTFEAPLQEYLGEAGDYRREVEWRALGYADAPGFFSKFRITDPVSFRVSGVTINEPHGGRAR